MSGAPAAFERDYFEASYRDYARQNPPRKLRHYRAAVQRFAPPRVPVRLLDVGCVFGTFLASVDPRWNIYGADVSEYAITEARRCLPHAHLEVVRNGTLPFAEQFEAITAWDVLEHIPEVEAVLPQVAGRLTEDGVFLFVVPVYDGPLGAVVSALDRDTTHVHRRSRAFWLELADRYFHVLEWWGIFRLLVAGTYYIHWPSRALRSIAPAIAVAARRKMP